MPLISIGDVNVNFPFEPYNCQVNYMLKLITCLQKGQNGILESPTGTGKTLCLLCGSLAWLDDKRAQISSRCWALGREPETQISGGSDYRVELANSLEKAAGQWSGEIAPPKIIYASRTHSQLSQAMQELKRTAYSHFRVCVMGSREQMCIHPQVSKEESNTAKVHLCRSKVTSRTCMFYNNVEASKGNFTNQVMDIEDLVTIGTKFKCCPYYIARELKNDSDVIFMPYNYLLDPKSRRAHGVELNGNIVIFDEAHNLERMCEESASFDWKSGDIAAAIHELTELANKLVDTVRHGEFGEDIMASSESSNEPDFTLEDLFKLKAVLTKLEKEIDAINIPNTEGISKPGIFIFELLSKVDLTFNNKNQVTDILDKVINHLTNETSGGIFQNKGHGLAKFSDVLKTVFSRDIPDQYSSGRSHQQEISKHYKVHIKENTKNFKKKASSWGALSSDDKQGRVLSYWCFSPGHAMEELKALGVRCVILTSGTLSPMASFQSEMGLEFPVQLSNPHVITKEQIWVGTVGKGPDGTRLSSAYDTRDREDYKASLGNTVVNLARVVPDGLLLFFSSYPVMQKCLENWQRNGIWNRVEQYKPIFVEPRFKAEFKTAMEGYYQKVQDRTSNGAVFAAVCRGKVSEGLDFADCNGRAVVITGLPYPPRMDPRVILKMQFLDETRARDRKGLTGQEWYKLQAFRAVNQAIGRVIRHRQDYGAIILCDHRFETKAVQNNLPSWVQPYLTNSANFGVALRDMMGFFKNVEKVVPSSKEIKTKIRATIPGCQGAHFEPTIRRSGDSERTTLPKSCDPVTHAPSLTHKKEELSMKSLKSQYEGTSCNVNGPTGLLDALSSEKTSYSALGEDTCNWTTSSGGACHSSQGRQKKKIILKPNVSGRSTTSTEFVQPDKAGCSGNRASCSVSSSTENTSTENNAKPNKPTVTSCSLQTAKDYLGQVKKSLNTASYAYFSKTLRVYKQDEDFNKMVSCLAEIFLDDESNYPFFRNFYKFVRPIHKCQFDEKCRELTGQGCGYNPRDEQRFKRSIITSENDDKRRKLNDGKTTICTNIDTKSTAKTVPVEGSSDHHLDRTSHLNSQLITVPSNQCVNILTSSNSSAQNRQKDAASLKASTVTSNRNIFDALDSDAAKTDNCDKISPSPSVKTVSAGRTAEELQMDKTSEYPESLNFSYLDEYRKRTKSGYTCGHCKNDANIPLEALCNHVCCLECWKICVKDKQACPECGKKVRRKHLKRICFPSGPNI